MELIDKLKQDILSTDWSVALNAADRLSQIRSEDVLQFLHSLLLSESSDARNASAIALQKVANKASTKPLIQAIKQLPPDSDRSTLVWALQSLDCSKYFSFFFDLALTGQYVERVHAVAILEAQSFWVTKDSLAKAQKKLDDYAAQNNLPTDAEELINHLKAILLHLQD